LHAVDHDHGDTHQRDLEGGRAGSGDHAVAQRDDVVGAPAGYELNVDCGPLQLRAHALGVERAGQGQDEAHAPALALQFGRGLQHRRQQPSELPLARAGHETDHGAVVVEREFPSGRVGGYARVDLVDQGMPHKAHGDAVAFVEGHLEREQHRHHVNEATDALCALRAPGPDLRTDVEQHGHADLACGFGELEVEFRVIDQDEQIGAVAAQACAHAFQLAHDAPPMHEHLDDADDRQPAAVDDAFHAARGEMRPPHAHHFGRPAALMQGLDEARGVVVAGGFPGRDHQSRGINGHGHRG